MSNLSAQVQRPSFTDRISNAILIALIMANVSWGQWGDSVVRVSESLAWGPFHDVELSGERAYCAMGYGLAILDVSTPSQISLLGEIGLPGTTEGVCLEGDCAYLASGSRGIQVLDVSSPLTPAFLGELDTPGYAYELVKGDSLLYVADGEGGLRVIDVTDLSQPQEVGWLGLGGWARDLCIDGNILYAAAEGAGLKVVDLANPAQPAVIASYNTGGIALGITKVDSLLYLADGQGGVLIFDVSDPQSPGLVGQWATTGVVHEVEVSGDCAYAANDSPGLMVLNISDPELPYQCGVYDSQGLAWSLAITGTTLFLADDTRGLAAIWIASPPNPVFIGNYSFPGEVKAVWVSGDFAYAARGYSGTLSILNVTDPGDPAQASNTLLGGNMVDVLINSAVCYSAHLTEGIYFTDVSNPASPSLITRKNTLGQSTETVPRYPYIYVADTWEGLVVVDLTNLNLAYHTYTSGFAKGVTLVGNIAYVSQWDAGVALVDISDPTQPSIIVEYNTPGLAHHCVVSGEYIYVADGYAGLTILRNGELYGEYDTEGSTWDVKIAGNTAYLADGGGGLLVLDIEDRSAPQYLGSYRTPGISREIFLDGGDIYVADQYCLGIYRYTGTGVRPGAGVSLPDQPGLSLYPNPFNERLSICAQLPINDRAEISVYNLMGQRVVELYHGWMPGVGEFFWEAGSCASGVYLVNLKTDDGSVTRKVILQK